MEEVETSVQFWNEFNIKITTIRTNLSELRCSVDGGTVSSGSIASIASIKESHSKLQAFATASTAVLPLYDIRRTQEVSVSAQVNSW